MANISSELIRKIREKTGAGMLDCKNALTESEGDFDKAVDILRKKGLATAAKKASRVAAEGLIGIASNGLQTAAMVEINSETDFVAKNDNFQKFVQKVSNIAASKDCSCVDCLLTEDMEGKTVKDSLTDLVAVIEENLNIRRMAKISVKKGVVSTYVHSVAAPGIGKIGVIVGLESSADLEKLEEFGKKLAMHIAAANPLYLTKECIPAEVLEREKQILFEQIKNLGQAEGKPDEVIEKMLSGRLQKFAADVALKEQVYVIDGKTKIADLLNDFSKQFGETKVSSFERFVLGEGVEKETKDFAQEVQAVSGTCPK